jgi:ribosome-binding factor A
MRGKISKPLEKPRLELDDASKGMLDSTGLEVMDVMNEALQTDEFYQIFKGTESAADVVEIIDVKMNRDFSHAHAFWRSKVVEMCFENLLAKNLAPTDIKIAEKMLLNMTNILQRNEAKFRSHMVRRINFRRVPRIYFKHEKPLEDMLTLIKEQNYIR